jgi:hypothetical protein
MRLPQRCKKLHGLSACQDCLSGGGQNADAQRNGGMDDAPPWEIIYVQ